MSDDPPTFAAAMASPDREKWLDGIRSELRAMRSKHVWDRAALPRGHRAIGCKWIFKRKYDSNGKVVRWKARLVAQGFAQREGVNYFDTFAPVLHYSPSASSLPSWPRWTTSCCRWTCPTAFLNAMCKEEVYMKAPPGMDEDEAVVDGQGRSVVKLNKTIYGIKQAPNEWNKDAELIPSCPSGGSGVPATRACMYVPVARVVP